MIASQELISWAPCTRVSGIAREFSLLKLYLSLLIDLGIVYVRIDDMNFELLKKFGIFRVNLLSIEKLLGKFSKR